MTNFQPKPKRRYKRYSSEFKREALLGASDEGMTDKAVAKGQKRGNREAKKSGKGIRRQGNHFLASG